MAAYIVKHIHIIKQDFPVAILTLQERKH